MLGSQKCERQGGADIESSLITNPPYIANGRDCSQRIEAGNRLVVSPTEDLSMGIGIHRGVCHKWIHGAQLDSIKGSFFHRAHGPWIAFKIGVLSAASQIIETAYGCLQLCARYIHF